MSAYLRNCRHWVFDMDGTLTIAVHDFLYIRRMLEIPDQADILGHLASLPSIEAEQKHAWLLEHERQLAINSQPAAGAVELVQHLHNQGRELAILTRNAKELAVLTLQAIDLLDYFSDNLILGREQAIPKPPAIKGGNSQVNIKTFIFFSFAMFSFWLLVSFEEE